MKNSCENYLFDDVSIFLVIQKTTNLEKLKKDQHSAIIKIIIKIH